VVPVQPGEPLRDDQREPHERRDLPVLEAGIATGLGIEERVLNHVGRIDPRPHPRVEPEVYHAGEAIPVGAEEIGEGGPSARSGIEELDVALDMFRRMAADFTDFRVNYWFWWRAWHSTGGKGYPAQDLVFSDGQGEATVMKAGQAFRLLWTTVRPGWRVQATAARGIDLRTDNEEIINGYEPNGNMMSRGVNVVAFEHPDQAASCVVITNATEQPRRLASLDGLRGEDARVHRLTRSGLADESRHVPLVAGKTAELDLSAHSITFCDLRQPLSSFPLLSSRPFSLGRHHGLAPEVQAADQALPGSGRQHG
jgi:hypothetical protein